MSKTLTTPQRGLLSKIAKNGRTSSRHMHAGTRTALESRGLIKVADYFPDGTALYRITLKGQFALIETKGEGK